MAEPFIGELKLVPYNFAPVGWAFCNGSVLPISGNEALFTLIGTTYGGDGQSTFNLPDLRGRAAMHMGTGFTIGETLGSESVTITTSQMPNHGHMLHVNPNIASNNSPIGGTLAKSTAGNFYGTAGDVTMNVSTSAGGNQPHENRQPYLVLNYIIALEGVFPTQN